MQGTQLACRLSAPRDSASTTGHAGDCCGPSHNSGTRVASEVLYRLFKQSLCGGGTLEAPALQGRGRGRALLSPEDTSTQGRGVGLVYLRGFHIRNSLNGAVPAPKGQAWMTTHLLGEGRAYPHGLLVKAHVWEEAGQR